MAKEVIPTDDAEFNEFLSRTLVENGFGNRITPSKNAYVQFKGDIGKVRYGMLPDVPTKTYTTICPPEWEPPKGKPDETGKPGDGTGECDKRHDDLWTQPGECDPRIFVLVDLNPRGHLTVKLNIDNAKLATLCQCLDADYEKELDVFVPAIINFCISVGSMFKEYDVSIKETYDIPEDSPDYPKDIMRFCDRAFVSFLENSKMMKDLVEKLEKMRRERI